MRRPNLRRPARIVTACFVLVGVSLPVAPVLAAPAPPGPGQPSQPPSAPAQPAEPPQLPKSPVYTGQIPPTPPPTSASPPAVEKPSPPPGDYKQKTQCIQSGATLPLTKKPWPQDLLQIGKAHGFATGANQTVAVIDTGVSEHRYLGSRLLRGGDYVKPSEGGTKDCDGHGTEVAGIIAANSGAGEGGSVGFNGMAPESNILSIRQTSNNFETNAQGANGEGRPAGTIETLASAVMWSLKRADELNTKLVAINISLTSCTTNPGPLDLNYRKLQAAIDYATEQGVVVVAAAGNKSDTPGKGCTEDNDDPDPSKLNSIPIPPWLGENVLSVGSVNQQGDPSKFSIAGPWVDVAAPGEDLISLDPASPDRLVNRSVKVSADAGTQGGPPQPEPIDGTSFAAPYVTGLVSLVREKYPNLSPQEVIHRIEATAQHPGGPTGHNNKVGYGMINPIAALTANLPEENGGKPAQAKNIPAKLPPPYDTNDTATTVALAGGGGALALLLLTAFVLHTMKRVRERRGDQG